MSRSGIRRKHAADAVQLHRISHPASHPYKMAHMSEATGSPRKMHQRIRIRSNESAPQQRIRPRGFQVGAAEPGLVPIQVHFEEE